MPIRPCAAGSRTQVIRIEAVERPLVGECKMASFRRLGSVEGRRKKSAGSAGWPCQFLAERQERADLCHVEAGCIYRYAPIKNRDDLSFIWRRKGRSSLYDAKRPSTCRLPAAPALVEISFSLSGAYLSPSAQAEARMINFASSQRLSSTLAAPEIPCISFSRLTVASRSTSCATVVRDGHAYWLNG